MTWKKPVETSLARLECDGLSNGTFSVPPFRVRIGEAICLHVLLPSPIWQEKVLPIFSGQRVHPGLRLFGTVVYLGRPIPRRRWWGGRHFPSARDWLTSEKGLTFEEAANALRPIDLPPDLSVGRIGWNERTLLALEACLLRPPELLVFDTCGNDSLTAHRIFERLASRPPELSLIYLKTRHEMDDPCLPGASCLELVRSPLLETSLE
jgi:hypothetical protein